MTPSPAVRVLSLGGGRQSTTLLYQSLAGELESLDLVVFADTQREPIAVQAHIEYLRSLCASRVPFVTVSRGNITVDALASTTRFASLPFFVRHDDGSVGRLRRQCTQEYKLEPIRKAIRHHLGIRPRRRVPAGVIVEQWIGFSLDEVARMKPSRHRWIQNRYPLIEREMRVTDCLRWCREHRLPVAPKSACCECPYHDDGYWRDMRDRRPTEWAEVVQFDHAIRQSLRGILRSAYLHRSCRPLDQVDLDHAPTPVHQPARQLPVWSTDNEICDEACFT